MRTNLLNDGRAFQKEIEMTAKVYAITGNATLAKVDPPTRVFGAGAARRMIYLANPFPDFVGAWTAEGGRALFIEAKSTKTHRLPFKRHGGLTLEQYSALMRWHFAGAAVAVVWQYAGCVALFNADMLAQASARGDKSLVHANGLSVARGTGACVWDFLATLKNA